MKLRVSGDLEIQIAGDEKPRIIFSATIGGITIKDLKMFALPIDHKVPVSIQPVDAAGNPAVIDGLATWSSSANSIATVQNVSTDSLSAEVVPAGTLGTCQINVQADADLGSGIQTITGTLDVQTIAGGAVGFTITTGALVPLP